MFFKRSSAKKKLEFDAAEKIPVLKCSICNGEQVAGLKDIRTGKFEEVMTIRHEEDLRVFQAMCGVKEIKKEY